MNKEKVKKLWKLCFDDSKEFMEMYFDLRYSNDVNIDIKSGNKVIAALQMIPYPMTFCGKVIDTSYISGACTHPDYRDKGVMRELLSQAHTRMLQKGISMSTLIPGEPWLFDYYKRMGYASVFGYSKKTFTLPQSVKTMPTTDITVRSITQLEDTAVYLYLHAKMMARPNAIQHTEMDFKVVLADLRLTGDSLYVATTPEEVIVGVAAAYRKGDSIQITELLTDTKEIETDLLKQIRETTKCETFTIMTPTLAHTEQHPLGMARIIDARNVLQLYASTFPKEELNIELTDEQLSANNGYYYLCNGKCMYGKERLPGVHLQLSIQELSERILSPLHPYMSLMING